MCLWSPASRNHQILSHLPISNLPLRQQLLCQGLPRLWLLLENPFKKKKKEESCYNQRGRGRREGTQDTSHLPCSACPPSTGGDSKGKHLPSSHQAIKQPLNSGVGGRKEATGPQIILGNSAPHLSNHCTPQIMFLSIPSTRSFALPPLPFQLGERTSFQLSQLH